MMQRAIAPVLAALLLLTPGAWGQAVIIARPAQPMPMDIGDEETPDEEPPPEIPEGIDMEGLAGAPGQPGAGEAAGISKDEIAALRAQYDALTAPEQGEMRAYYADMGVDLEALFGITAARTAEQSKGQEITMAMREMDFARRPQSVLAARARLGFGQVPYPNPQTAPGMEIAKWIQLHVMAGEWQTLAAYLKSRPLPESEPVYAAIMQSLNRGDPGLLPEEVLALAEASPGEFKPWQLKALGTMLKTAAAKHGTASMLEQLSAGTRFFGTRDAETRRRTVDFLAGGGLLREAYAYFPPLEEARTAQDAALVVIHGRYKLDLAAQGVEGPEAEALRTEAWALFCEATLYDKGSLDARREALKQAVGLLSRVPRARVAPWLEQVFASPVLGPAALENIALSAVAIGDSKLDVEQRAQAVLTLKEAVDILLARPEIDSASLRVPLRMLTTALVTEMEKTTTEKGKQREVAREAQLLLRAIPSERWFKALEPSLAARARRACIGIATLADETDLALELLKAAVTDSPREAPATANHFLACWEQRLNPQQDDMNEMFGYIYFYREYIPMAPLTRGRQRRNLERLHTLMQTLAAIGVEPRRLPGVVSAFKACHAATEVYDRADIARVFGEFARIPSSTAAGLAMTMGASLNGDWRSRAAQRTAGTKRSDSEIAVLVDKGYGLALELTDAAIQGEPDEWKWSVLRASLTFDRMQFQTTQGKIADAAAQNEYRRAAFDAFAAAAARYAKALEAGQERDDPSLFRRWFGAAMGAAELNFLRVDDLPKEGSPQYDQIDEIRKAMDALPGEARDRHIAAFARDAQAAVGRADPEIKPRLVKHALRVIRDHPSGASLRSMDELYRDLVKDEIKLRVTLDGADRVGVKQPFGVQLSLRFTNSVDRETGGFSKYLQNGVWGRVGNSYRPIDYRDQIQKDIESAFNKQFTVDAIGFFDPFMPARGVVEDGQDGWLEKPLAYVILSRTDAAVDRLPQITLDMQFTDQTGPVTLVLASNTPLLATEASATTRPVLDMTVAQIVDVRAVNAGEGAKAVKLEVQVRGRGVLPHVRDVLSGLDDALPGYRIAEDGIEAQPPILLQEGEVVTGRFGWRNAYDEPKEGYPEPDEQGMYRLKSDRTFTITYTPSGAAPGAAFRLPELREGLKASLESRYYADLDIVPVTGTSVPISISAWTPLRLILLGLIAALVLVIGFLVWKRRGVRAHVALPAFAPARMTPLGVVTCLRRVRDERNGALDSHQRDALEREISGIELKCFGPGSTPLGEQELRAAVQRWVAAER